MATPSLHEYPRKRDFRHNRESPDAALTAQADDLYVKHRHAARHEHFDLRIEQDGVLRSWALPKGAGTGERGAAAAIEVEDHPLEYGVSKEPSPGE